jgi:hypothetical protein
VAAEVGIGWAQFRVRNRIIFADFSGLGWAGCASF